MPNLSNEAAHEYWEDYNDPTVYRVVSFMESAEEGTLDGEPELEAALKKLGDAMEKMGKIDLQQEAKFIEVLAYLKAARMLHIMQSLDTAYPGAASKLLSYAEKNTASPDDINNLFMRRNIIFERLRLLLRVFAPERLTTIAKVLEEGTNE